MNKTIYPNIVRGGIAIPLDRRNYYYILGRSHEDKVNPITKEIEKGKGVHIGNDSKTGLEVENREIVKMENDGIKVYSAVPMLAGKSPAERVLMGEDPNKVFAAQERFKDVNNINDDGTRKAKLGLQDKNTKTKINPFGALQKLIHGDTNNKLPIKSESKFAGLKTHDGRGYNSDYIDYIYESLSKSNLNKMQQATVLANIIYESGGDPFALNKNTGKDYGLLQWVDRYTKTKETDPYKEIDNQLKYFYSTINNLDDQVSWTHGGEGTGYQSRTDAYADFNSEDPVLVNKGFGQGYVRFAGKDPTNRGKLMQQIYDRIKQFGGDMKHTLVEVNIGGNSKLIRVPSRSSTGKSERSEGRDKAKLGSEYGKLKPINLKHMSITTPIAKINIPSTKIPAAPIPTIANSGIWGDVIGAGSNIIGSLITRGINNKMINNLKPPTMPVLETAKKSPTKYITNSIEGEIKDNLAEYERRISGNTASSRVDLALRNKARNDTIKKLIEVHNYKENVETERLRGDIMNQQSVDARNIERINRHLTNVTDVDNEKIKMRADNNVSTVQNINQGVQDLLARRDRRTSFNKTLMAQTFANPNLPAELFYAAGIWDKNTYDMYRKQYAKS